MRMPRYDAEFRDSSPEESHERHKNLEKGDVPLYRSYGVRRRKFPILEKINMVFMRVVFLWIIGTLGVALFIAVTTLLLFANLLVATVFVLLVTSIVLTVATRTLRKRIGAERKIKRMCRKNGFDLKRKRSPMMSFRWNTAEPDFELVTEGRVYLVHYLTAGHYNSSLTFERASEIIYTKYPLRNRFTLAFGLKPIVKRIRTEFTELPQREGRLVERVILVNPVCKEMLERGRDGGRVATGNGARLFGYTVYTVSGFTDAVIRDNKKDG